jgi:hypothetical protein
MDARVQPETLDPLDRYYQLVHSLSRALPAVSTAPDDLLRRQDAAIAGVVSPPEPQPAPEAEAEPQPNPIAERARLIHRSGRMPPKTMCSTPWSPAAPLRPNSAAAPFA